MKPVLEHYLEIFRELKRLEKLGFPFVEPGAEPMLPRTIYVGAGQQIAISEKIDRAIAAISRVTRENKTHIKATHTQKDWQAVVRRAFGPVLANFDLGQPENEAASWLKAEVGAAITEIENAGSVPVEIAFGTSWLNMPEISFSVGPATLEARETWINRLHAEGRISKTTLRRTLRRWAGNKLPDRKPSNDKHVEQSIANTVDGSPYVISVKIEGLSTEFTVDRAARIARLVLTGISLIWEQPSNALRGLNLDYDDHPKQRRVLWLPKNGLVSASYRLRAYPHGPTITVKEWNKQKSDKEPIFRQLDAITTYIATNQCDAARKEVIRKLDVALRWFQEGCRADDNLLAVTHFAACLDTLADGKREGGIRVLLDRQCGLTPGTAAYPDGPTISQILTAIYASGRSRFLHGSTEAHLHDWAENRGFAELLSRRALVACIFAADANPALSDFCA